MAHQSLPKPRRLKTKLARWPMTASANHAVTPRPCNPPSSRRMDHWGARLWVLHSLHFNWGVTMSSACCRTSEGQLRKAPHSGGAQAVISSAPCLASVAPQFFLLALVELFFLERHLFIILVRLRNQGIQLKENDTLVSAYPISIHQPRSGPPLLSPTRVQPVPH